MLFFLGFVMYYFSVHFKDYSLIHDTLYFFVFFSLGNMLNEFFIQTNKYRIQTVFVIFFSLLPFFVATQYYWLHNQDMHVIPFFGVTMIGVFIIFAFSRLLSYYGSLNFIRIVGLHSLYIYLMHLLIISSSRMLLVNILKVEVSEVILLTGWTAGVFLPIILYKWMRTNFFKYLFQMKY